ncbi:MAG TPA: hypothetical protein QGH10_07640 [Armatimonadota bacterium]|nr:hypothetical protein [Armatimonadota bacterium]
MSQNCTYPVTSGIESSWRRLRPAPVVFALALILASAGWTQGTAKSSVAALPLHVAVGGVSADAGIAASRFIAAAYELTGRHKVADTGDVEAALRDREMNPPFGVGHLQLLADVLGVDTVVHGSVRGLTYDPEARSASVVIAVEVVDGRRGTLKGRHEANGAHVAPADVASTQQSVIMGALARAAEQVVEDITGIEVNAPDASADPEAVAETNAAETDAPGTDAEAAVSEGGTPAETALVPAVIPGSEAAEDGPKSTVPTGDLIVKIDPRPAEPVVEAPAADTTPEADQPEPTTPTNEPIVIVVKPPGEDKPAPRPEPRPDYRDDIWESELPPVTVKILAKIGSGQVLTTLGRNGAIARKMELDVYRINVSRDGESTRRRIGRIRVTKKNRSDAVARVLEGGNLLSTGDVGYFLGE